MIPENATYTASEVKVLTETASKVAYALGRKDALTEVADEMGAEQDDPRIGFVTLQTDWYTWRMLLAAKTSSQAAGATSEATSWVPGHPEVSEAVRSPQEPCGHPTCPCADMHSHPDSEATK
jgi:hypothetical protein